MRQTETKLDYTRTHDLTVEEVKACPAFSDLTDEELQCVISTLKSFTVIVFESDKKYQKSLEYLQRKS
ncbi:hypothetical protein [Mucilaginibacter sp. HD30]